jgi:lipopolysaccharide transport system permease protein
MFAGHSLFAAKPSSSGTPLAPEQKVEPTDARPITVRRPPGSVAWTASARSLWEHRDLFWALTRHRVRVRYKQSLLGLAWAVLQPLALMLIFTLAFGRIARMPSEGIPYPLFVYSGLLTWSFLSTGLSNATNAVVSHAQLITKVYFPREILPLTYVAAGLFDLAIGFLVLAGLLAYFDYSLTWSAIFALPVLLLLTLLVTGAGFLLAAAQVHFRDVGIAVPLLIYLWLFSTPIGYPLSSVPEQYRFWFLLNPMTGIVEGFRDAVLRGVMPDAQLLVVPAAVAVVLLPVAYGLFKRVESTMADVV